MQIAQSPAALVIGRRVYCILYGGKYGTIVNIKGQPGIGPQVRSLGGGVIMTGGSCHVDIIWDNGSQSPHVPECIILGVQWKLFDEIVGAEEIAAAQANSVIFTAQQKAKADAERIAKAAADAAALEAGRAVGLIPESEFRTSGKRGSAAASNLRAELKAVGIKARVKQDGYSALNVWVSADNLAAAKTIAAKYKAGNFDGMTDCYEYSTSAWGRVFGDVQYVFIYTE